MPFSINEFAKIFEDLQTVAKFIKISKILAKK